MLRGRESLIRMVGKRRRLQSHEDALLSPHPNHKRAEDQATVHRITSGQTTANPNAEIITSLEHDFPDMTVPCVSVGEFCEDIVVNDDAMKAELKNQDMDWVLCPVCGKSIRGTDIIINDHLDMCLARGSRRKLTQCTLLQFNLGLSTNQEACGDQMILADKDSKQEDIEQKFAADSVGAVLASSLSRKRISNGENTVAILNRNARNSGSEVQPQEETNITETLKKGRTRANCGFEPLSSGTLNGMVSFNTEGDMPFRDIPSNNAVDVNDNTDAMKYKMITEGEKDLCAHGESHKSWTKYRNINIHVDDGEKKVVEMTALNKKGKTQTSGKDLRDLSSSFSKEANAIASSELAQNEMPQDNVHLDRISNNLSLEALETYIVGRKFNHEVKVKQGAGISVIRDPQNPKDQNAIKVFYLGSESEPALGHLPRGLALYLSPLLDNGSLQIEGFITSIPEHPFASVPVKLLCQKMLINGQENLDKEKLFESLWLKAVHVAKMSNSIPLDSPKYQRNFKVLIQTVLEHHSHLFTNVEKTFIVSFQSLSGDGQRLFIRLYQRKGPWFRVSNLSYSDISDVKAACEELLAAAYVNSSESETESSEGIIGELLEVLTLPELRQLAGIILLKKKRDVGAAKREELLEWLVIAATAQKKEKFLLSATGDTCLSLLRLFSEMAGCCVKISDLAKLLFWRIQRLFFLNGEQDLSAFLLVDMGLIKYPDYNCSQTESIFSNRDDLLSYEQALEVAQIMDMALEANDMLKVTRCIEKSTCYLSTQQADGKLQSGFSESHPMFLSSFSAAWVYTKILTLGVSVLERKHRYKEAIELLKYLLSKSCCPGQRGYWTVRLAVDLEHIGHTEESLSVAEKGIDDAWIRAGDQMALQRRVLRLGKPPRRWKKPAFAKAVGRKIKEVYVRGRPLNSATGTKSRFYGYDGQQCSVEQLALQYYAGEEGGNWQGVHSEGGIWMTFFGLLMWDVLFADVPDVFWTPFQTAPLDLGTDYFYSNRENLIAAQLNKIRMGEAERILAASWEAHAGTSCRGVNWERFSLTDLQTIASCIGGPALAAVCKLLAEDYGSWAGGMPDLLLWRTFSDDRDVPCRKCGCQLTSTGKSDTLCCCFDDTVKNLRKHVPGGEAKLVEVKGPRDHLSEQQRAWILILMDAGICTEVCKIIELPKKDE